MRVSLAYYRGSKKIIGDIVSIFGVLLLRVFVAVRCKLLYASRCKRRFRLVLSLVALSTSTFYASSVGNGGCVRRRRVVGTFLSSICS